MNRRAALPRRARVVLGALTVLLAAYVAHLVFSIGNPLPGFWDRVYNAIEFGAEK